jgi:hypothetical protein
MAETIQEWHVVDPEPETMSDEDNYEVEETILVIWDGEDPLAAMALVSDTWPPLSQPEWQQHDTSQLHSIPPEIIPIPSEHRELPIPPLSQPVWQHDTSQLHSIPLEMIPIPSEHRELPFPPLSHPEWQQHDISELHSIPPEMIPIPSEHRELPLQVDKFTAPAATTRPSAVAKNAATLSSMAAKEYAAAPPKLWKPWETSSSDSGDNSSMNKGSGTSFTIDCDREEVVPQTVVGQDFQQEYDLWLKSNSSSLLLGAAPGVDTEAEEAEEFRNREVGEGPGNKQGSNLAVVSDRSDMPLLDLSDLSSLLSRIGSRSNIEKNTLKMCIIT